MVRGGPRGRIFEHVLFFTQTLVDNFSRPIIYALGSSHARGPNPVSVSPTPSGDDHSKLRIVQFSQETALSKSIRRKAKSEGKTMLHDYLHKIVSIW